MSTKHNSILLTLFLLFTFSVSLILSEEKIFTATDHVKLLMPSNITIAPDGKKIAYTVRSADLENSKWITQIYSVAAADRTVKQLTSSAANCTSPAWSPDNKWLTFLTSREHLDANLQKQSGTTQLFALPADGGEAETWTSLLNDVEEYTWSPDGSSIALLSEEELPKEKQDVLDKNKKQKKDWTSSLDPKPGKDLWILTVSTHSIKKIKPLDCGTTSLSWAPDNAHLIFQTNYTGEYDDEQKNDIWSIDLSGNTIQLTDSPGPETHPKFSPDGKSIAFITQTVPDIEFAKTELSVMGSDGKDRKSLTAAFSYSVTNFHWNPDGKSLICLVNEKTSSALYKIDRITGKPEKLTPADFVVSEISLAKDGTVATTVESASTLKEIALLKKGKFEPLTNYSSLVAGYATGNQEVVTIKSRDGKFDIDAIVVKPANFTEGKKYPLLLAYHGGPYGDFDNKFYQYYPIRLLSREGVIIVMPNVRGSSGYTDEFSQSNRYDLGGGDFRDAMDVVDNLIARGWVDSTKMGVMGGSYGGYMTNWTISQTARFKAAVSLYGIFSFFTDWSNSWQPAFEKMYFGYYYWERPIDMNSLWVNRAPQSYARNIVTPTLILQGTEDQYTNISNSREMYQTLKSMGRIVEFVVYPRAEHGLRTEPNQYIDVLERSVGWFKKYVMNASE